MENLVSSALSLLPGEQVLYQGELYCIKLSLSLEAVLIAKVNTGDQKQVKIADLLPVTTVKAQDVIPKPIDTTSVSANDWEIAKHRESVIAPLTQLKRCSLLHAKETGKQLDLSWRQVYKLIKRYRTSGYQLTSLLPIKHTGGKDKGRLPDDVETIIQVTIDELYLTKQKNKPSVIVEEVRRRCRMNRLRLPADMTIRQRIYRLSQQKILKAREGAQVAQHHCAPAAGSFPEVNYPLAILQIDHTPVDLIIVDEFCRKPIGRPYLTVAIDVFSRCITGFLLSLEAPSAVSVGLCLLHSIFDKDKWLVERSIQTHWPIWGKPDCIYVDNAKEFHSEALQRGCDVHGIRIDYRPIGQPHYGGIIERLIGTLMQLVHQLPGTTFSNVAERGNYPSEQKAALTLRELEHWLTIAITDYYHQKIHGGLKTSPIERYKAGILGGEDGVQRGRGYPPRIHNRLAFLTDFLPIERRTLQRHGFTLDHIDYYHPLLSPLIADRKKHGKFIIRRDPRDLSRIYVLDSLSNYYLEIPYRTLSRPTITLWEHRQALISLREKSIEQVDENLIFKAVEKMRAITKEAVVNSKQARRRHEWAQQAQVTLQDGVILQSQNQPSEPIDRLIPIKRFEDIELW